MIGWFILFLIFIVIYLTRVQEGFIGITDITPVDAMQTYIQNDLDTTRKAKKRLVYVIYKQQADNDITTKINKTIMGLPRNKDIYPILRVFTVKNTNKSTCLFSTFYNRPLDYSEVIVLTNNLKSTVKDNTQLFTYVNTDDRIFYEKMIQTIQSKNKPV